MSQLIVLAAPHKAEPIVKMMMPPYNTGFLPAISEKRPPGMLDRLLQHLHSGVKAVVASKYACGQPNDVVSRLHVPTHPYCEGLACKSDAMLGNAVATIFEVSPAQAVMARTV